MDLKGRVAILTRAADPIGRVTCTMPVVVADVAQEKIASMEVHLATDEANYIVGQVITVDGGVKIQYMKGGEIL